MPAVYRLYKTLINSSLRSPTYMKFRTHITRCRLVPSAEFCKEGGPEWSMAIEPMHEQNLGDAPPMIKLKVSKANKEGRGMGKKW